MTKIQQRNEQILKMRGEGASPREVATHFGITPQLVSCIEKANNAAKAMEVRRATLQQQLRDADDLDKPWKAADLVDSLSLTNRTKAALKFHYDWPETERITLREVMELAISPVEDSKPGYLIAPLLSIQRFGVMGLCDVVRVFTITDLGERCNQEWQRKLERLKCSVRVHGSPTWWSKPTAMILERLGHMKGPK